MPHGSVWVPSGVCRSPWECVWVPPGSVWVPSGVCGPSGSVWVSLYGHSRGCSQPACLAAALGGRGHAPLGVLLLTDSSGAFPNTGARGLGCKGEAPPCQDPCPSARPTRRQHTAARGVGVTPWARGTHPGTCVDPPASGRNRARPLCRAVRDRKFPVTPFNRSSHRRAQTPLSSMESTGAAALPAQTCAQPPEILCTEPQRPHHGGLIVYCSLSTSPLQIIRHQKKNK